MPAIQALILDYGGVLSWPQPDDWFQIVAERLGVASDVVLILVSSCLTVTPSPAPFREASMKSGPPGSRLPRCRRSRCLPRRPQAQGCGWGSVR